VVEDDQRRVGRGDLLHLLHVGAARVGVELARLRVEQRVVRRVGVAAGVVRPQAGLARVERRQEVLRVEAVDAARPAEDGDVEVLLVVEAGEQGGELLRPHDDVEAELPPRLGDDERGLVADGVVGLGGGEDLDGGDGLLRLRGAEGQRQRQERGHPAGGLTVRAIHERLLLYCDA
jgi:hypothetical protein